MEFSAEDWDRWRKGAWSLLAQMDWLRGLRAAVALSAPLVLGDLLHIPNLGWAALGGFEAILADTGGPYRSRMRALATLSIGGGAGVFLGSLVGGSLHWALPLTVLWCFAWSYLPVLGPPFTSAGVLVQVVYVCGIGAPSPDWRTALNLGLLLLAGGAWASVLSLFLWPLDPYRPARGAIAHCFEELASFLGSIRELADRPHANASLWHRLAQHHQYRVRQAVERGWEAVAHVRAERLSETAQSQHLIVLLETADMLIARTVALAEHLEVQAATDAENPGCFRVGVTGLEALRAAEVWVASLLTRRRVGDPASIRGKREEIQRLPQTLAGCTDRMGSTERFLLAQINEAASLLDTAVESSACLRLTNAKEKVLRAPAASAGHFGYVYERLGQLRQGWNLDLLIANFARGSLPLRHALRVAVVCGFDVATILRLEINHGYWLLMTSLIVLQPYVAGTLRRGVERIGGTVAGGIVAALLAMALHSQGATAAVLFPCALLSLAILPVSYAAFAFFLTPTFVLAWMPYSGDWQLAFIRIGNTIVGAVLSVAAMLFLFPAYERERTPKHLQESLAANRRYLAQLSAAWRARSQSSRLLANARRGTGLAHNASEESLERLLAENWPRPKPFGKFASSFVTYLRRFAQGVTALTTLEGEWEWKLSEGVQWRLAFLERRLAWLEAQVSSGGRHRGEDWPEMPVAAAASPEHPGERQLERLERQTGVLYRQLTALQEHGWIPENKG